MPFGQRNEISFLFCETNTAFKLPEYRNRFCSPNYKQFFVFVSESTSCLVTSSITNKHTDHIEKASVLMTQQDRGDFDFGRGA